jgi:hypothetical protein
MYRTCAVIVSPTMSSQAVRPYWANMGDFEEVMSGVSDASMFIDAMRAAGMGPGGFSGTLIIPINDVSCSAVQTLQMCSLRKQRRCALHVT